MGLRTTFADIAKAAGVSKSTVARALQGNSRVSEETRRLVLAAAERLGYQPDPALRILSSYRWKRDAENPSSALAYVVMQTDASARLGAMFHPFLRTRARELGYSLEVFNLHDYRSGRKLSDVLYARGIRGVIFQPIISNEVAFDFHWERFAAVGCGIGEYRLPIHCVDMNLFSCTRLAWKACREHGYERIGGALYHQHGPDQNDSLRDAAFLYEQSRLPASVERIPLFSGSMSDRKGCLEWYLKYRPDAVIALNGTLFWDLRDAGIRVPADVGLCLLVDDQDTVMTSVHRAYDVIATASVDWVDQLLHQNKFGLPQVPQEILIEPQLNPGATLLMRP